MSNFLNAAHEMKEELIHYRRFLHQIPEVGDNLPQTTRFVMEKLTEMNIEPEEICKGGITAVIGGRKGGKVILLRADMDALPMIEESGLAFSATNGCAHTCGHDIHTAMLLGAAKLLKQYEEELDGTVKLMFQPGEENMAGAAAMLHSGVLQNPKVDAAMALHVFPGNMHVGMMYWGTGPILASSDVFRITVSGKGGHGAIPQNAIDPIHVAVHIYMALQEILTREVDPQEPIVLTIGTLHAGDAPNVIPETAVMTGSLRTFSKDVRVFVKTRLEEIAAGTAKTFRADCTVEYMGGLCPTVNDEALALEIRKYMNELGIQLLPFPRQMGSEDFALVAEAVPSVFLGIGAGGAEPYYHKGGSHNSKVIFNEDVLPLGAAALSYSAYHWLKNHC
ncbi:M20 metallopeptidase family protein [Geosporobacter ferrireducens]|uniref:M20 metallopeptidase family protein n=1 Tax=Geosporobacter ferrireducens TaxID=1424294 RepID=UPI00139F02C6|nr:M20 family metallopeptidase [Geosporobacter ferrireducens]MTI53656.1 amidohydrolase [Geosporobacter ferrireducens]